MIDGIASEPFSAKGLPPFDGDTGFMQQVIDYTRTNYASPRATVEQEIREWSGMATPDEEGVKDEEKKRKKRNKKKIKKIEKLLPEYEKLAQLGNQEAVDIVQKLNEATTLLAQNQDVDLGDIIGRDESDAADREMDREEALEAAEEAAANKAAEPVRASRPAQPKPSREKVSREEIGRASC